jgi:hypothetical protein
VGGNVVDGINYLELSPELKQVFFIGDGLTDSGVPQQITPPAGATRLYLGTFDLEGWFDNIGSFEVNISDATPPVNEVPLAVNDSANADTGASIIISVLDNDQGLADTPIMVSISADPMDGTAIAGADNKVTYTSNPGFTGDDDFEYTATDRDGEASSATVMVTVIDPNANTIPVAMDDVASVDSGATVDINVLANDQGLSNVPLVVSISIDPVDGSAQVLADNRISYTADNNFVGVDSFEYIVTDSDGEASSGTVVVTVTDPNAGGTGVIPVANDDSASATSAGNIVINVLANDQRLDDGPVVVSIFSAPANGSAFVLTDNRVSYTADFGFVGDDEFRYRVTDSHGDAATATVALSVSDPVIVVTKSRKVGGGAFDYLSLLWMLFAATMLARRPGYCWAASKLPTPREARH